MGKRGPKAEDLTGQTFNMLTAIQRVEPDPKYVKHFGCALWLCKCKCGKMAVVRSHDLKSSHTKSCGCLRGKNLITQKQLMGILTNGCDRAERIKDYGWYNWFLARIQSLPSAEGKEV